jgi:gliding motility-associated-like protein
MKVVNRILFLLITVLVNLLLPNLSIAGNIFPVDTIRVYTQNCSGEEPVCIGLPSDKISGYEITVNGIPYAGLLKGCDFDTIVSYAYHTLPGSGNSGPYHLDSWVVNGVQYKGNFVNVSALVTMMNQWDPAGKWVHLPASLTIKGGNPGSTYSQMQITTSSNLPAVLGMSFGLHAKGTEITLKTGIHMLVVTEKSTGLRDTLTVVLRCGVKPIPSTVFETIPANDFYFTYKINSSELSGPPVSISNICNTQSGTYVQFALNAGKNEVLYKGLRCGGQESACIVVCDALGICDTTYLVVTVDFSLCQRKSEYFKDTVLLNFTKTICLDKNRLSGKIIEVDNLCELESGRHVDFDYDPLTHCLSYTGITVGMERACLLIKDEFGNQDTSYVSVVVKKPETGIIIDTLELGKEKTICVDISELAGNIINISNLCPAKSGNKLDFKVDALTLCINVKGQNAGLESACIVLCDNYGVCDTTSLTINVIQSKPDPCLNSHPPLANNDLAATLLNTHVNIQLLSNDALGSCPDYTIAVPEDGAKGGPEKGLVILNSDLTIDYLPDNGFCGFDTFQYYLCNPVGCDTAFVIVVVDCIPPDSVIVNSGMSPNGDGVNDFFTIKNIEKYPENEVRVFNRWGAVVYSGRGYANQWGGSFRKDELPDGTYFYTVKIKGNKEKNFKGYLQIIR